MLKYFAFVLCTVVLVHGGAHLKSSIKTDQQQHDSLNVCTIGHWAHATAWAISYDKTRDLVFLGSCGCIYVLDVSNPSEPKQISQFKHSLCNTCGLYYDQSEQTLYICSGVSGFKIWNLDDPSQPVELGHYDTPGYACGTHVCDQYAFIACAYAGLLIIDISDPSDPIEVGHFDMTNATCVQVSDKYAYVADLGLRILDVSDPSSPKEVGYYDTPGVAFSVQIVDNYAYIADDWCGLRIIDISEPKKPKEVGYLLTPGYAWGVYVVDSYAYVSACEEGLRVIDITLPNNPEEVAYYTTAVAALNAQVLDSHIYVVVENGLRIYAILIKGRNE